MTTLILAWKKKASIKLDGAALRVSTQSKADRWLPLKRLDYVVCGPQARWESKALIACACRQITVLLVGDSGPCSVLVPLVKTNKSGTNDMLKNNLVLFMAFIEGQVLLRHWFLSRRIYWDRLIQTQLKLLRRPEKPPCGNKIIKALPWIPAVVSKVLLRDFMFTADLMETQLRNFNLVEEMSQLLGLRLYHFMIKRGRFFPESRASNPQDEPAWLTLSAQHKQRLVSICHQEAQSLHRFLLENRYELQNPLPDLL